MSRQRMAGIAVILLGALVAILSVLEGAWLVVGFGLICMMLGGVLIRTSAA